MKKLTLSKESKTKVLELVETEIDWSLRLDDGWENFHRNIKKLIIRSGDGVITGTQEQINYILECLRD